MVPFASIPSPSTGELEVGPLTLHGYGVILLLGIAAGVWLSGLRWTRRGGDWDLIFRTALWAVAAGIVGARLYHLATSWEAVPDEWWGPFAIWEGGLGGLGGVAAGILAGAIVVKRSGESVLAMMDAAAPGILLAQGVGRVGNYVNQELFGRPTDLPWGLEIDPQNRPEGFEQHETFHPTFLYELVWDSVGVAVLLWLDSRVRFRPPALFGVYLAWYAFGRFFWELLRIDEPVPHALGLRLNAWIAVLLFLVGIALFVWAQLLRRGRPTERARAAAPEGPKMAIPKPVRRRR